MSDLINEPDAPRLIYGLRDTGYNFKTAAADIIDNSIAANATEVNILIELQSDGRKFVYFGDNGDGMDSEGLFNAMRYGAPVRESAESLGKFGLGLKTASTSVCLRLSVISRKSPEDPLEKLTWDLEHVADANAWEMLQEPVDADEKEVFDELCGEKGSLVIWAKCDRILSKEYDEPGGTKEQQAIKRLRDSLTKHASLVYYRFLDEQDSRERNVSMTINGERVSPWNPFFPERSEQVLPEEQQSIEIETESGEIGVASIRAFILPHSRDLTREEKDKARISNRAQGFYIHREGRLIQDGSWLGVFGAPEPHTSLLRIEFDFGHDLDDAFKVDVKKSRILFDPALEDYLRELLRPIYREAGNRYRRTKQKQLAKNGVDHSSSNRDVAGAKSAKRATVDSVDQASQSATVTNNRGQRIRIRQPVQDQVNQDSIHIEAVDSIHSGELWQPALRSSDSANYVTGVLLNKHHDFYHKIYQRAAANGYAVEGMDLLFWAFAAAEQNNSDEELEPIFRELREEISLNLRRLLRDLPEPEDAELYDED